MASYEHLASKQIPCPVIAPVINDRGMLHFVVLWRVSARSVVVGDPAAGVERWSREKFLERWRGPGIDRAEGDGSGALLIVIPSARLEKTHDRSRLRRLWALADPRRGIPVRVPRDGARPRVVLVRAAADRPRGGLQPSLAAECHGRGNAAGAGPARRLQPDAAVSSGPPRPEDRRRAVRRVPEP